MSQNDVDQIRVTALVQRIGGDADDEIAEVLRPLLDKKAHHAELLLALRQDPERAIARLETLGEAHGFSRRNAADVLDIVVEHTDAERAARAMREQLTPDRVSELLGARGDLASSAALIADADVVLDALLADVQATLPDPSLWSRGLSGADPLMVDTARDDDAEEEEVEDDADDGDSASDAPVADGDNEVDAAVLATACAVVLAWAMKLKGRADWDRFLGMRALAGLTFGELVYVACVRVVRASRSGAADGEAEELSDLLGGESIMDSSVHASALFDEVGLSNEICQAISERFGGQMPTLDAEEFEAARARLAKRRKWLEREDGSHQVRAATDKAARELDL
ncbi:MAG: hypothetical protein Q7T01_04260 [bacterium]|nr:hypothetical protein [bacterium]